MLPVVYVLHTVSLLLYTLLWVITPCHISLNFLILFISLRQSLKWPRLALNLPENYPDHLVFPFLPPEFWYYMHAPNVHFIPCWGLNLKHCAQCASTLPTEPHIQTPVPLFGIGHIVLLYYRYCLYIVTISNLNYLFKKRDLSLVLVICRPQWSQIKNNNIHFCFPVPVHIESQ